ncbi:MAG: universal stress protein, partial [Gammaproteobacteria bacterium]|nr:universal stress protein [Phycisphaerae bacterium]NIP52530.1 universal stress protein [Phycisphaerae bacterium]NIR95378.1 universal stress protein [Gammaproteobacteria bacterium]NIW47265.1 universal stress protein [Gammaproteobacteria bacterium]NIX31034.1 universal stress protein [Phycisphaerae bacterium]
MENIIDRLTGKSSELLSYYDVIQKLKIVNQTEQGVQDIPLEAIVGSVGRYTDFSRTFLPMQDNDATRWARVAAVPFNELPPIDVYQIGNSYFVLDGNHRVSIARQRGMKFIPAEVTEVRTRAPLPPDVSPEKLILQAEYVSFLENTNFDKLRPDADLRVSVPGQYR